MTKMAYFRVVLFAIAAFVANTTEFIPVALLSDIGKSFEIPVSKVGIMITVYAWVVTIMSLPFMIIFSKTERRKLLMVVFTVFILGHILSALSWNFEVLIISRICIALSHAVFWSITASLVMRVAPKGKKQQALAWLTLGTAMALILGLPLGRIIGQLLGWRVTFGLIGLLAFIIMVLMYKFLPNLKAKNTGSLSSVPIVLKRPLILGIFALTATAIVAHFTAYSYIEPFMIQISHMSNDMATLVLLIFGISGIVASWIFGRFNPKYPNILMRTALITLMISLLCLAPLSQHHIFMYALIFLWGVSISCLGLCMMLRILLYAPDATDIATAMYSGMFNLGIGGGALLGGIVMDRIGLINIGWVGALLTFIGLIIHLTVHYRYQHTAPQPNHRNVEILH
nr:sugar transporter [Basilea psittacipulmonis]